DAIPPGIAGGVQGPHNCSLWRRTEHFGVLALHGGPPVVTASKLIREHLLHTRMLPVRTRVTPNPLADPHSTSTAPQRLISVSVAVGRRRVRGVGRNGVPGRCSHEDGHSTIGEALLTCSMCAPTSWDGFGNTAREVS